MPTDETPAPWTPTDDAGGLIFATRLPGRPEEFTTARLGWDDLATPAEGGPLWINLDLSRGRAAAWLREESGLPEPVIESMLAEETRPHAQLAGDGLLLIARGVNMNPGADPDDLIVLRLWIEPGRIITLRDVRFQTIADLRIQASQGEGSDRPGEFLAAVATGLVSRLGPTVDNLEDMLDDIEQAMLDNDQSDDPKMRSQVATIRRQAIGYRRYLVPQREAFGRLGLATSPLLEERDRLELRVAAEGVTRITEALEELRDRAAVTAEELRARHEARIGRTLYLLTIVATIALPLGIITGLLGVNVGGIPLADSHAGFLVVCGVLAAIVALEVVLFRVARWL